MFCNENDHNIIDNHGEEVCTKCGWVVNDRLPSNVQYTNMTKSTFNRIYQKVDIAYDNPHKKTGRYYGKIQSLLKNNTLKDPMDNRYWNTCSKYVNTLKDFLSITKQEEDDIKHFMKKIFKYEPFFNDFEQRIYYLNSIYRGLIII
jgi:hypothetical protein